MDTLALASPVPTGDWIAGATAVLGAIMFAFFKWGLPAIQKRNGSHHRASEATRFVESRVDARDEGRWQGALMANIEQQTEAMRAMTELMRSQHHEVMTAIKEHDERARAAINAVQPILRRKQR